MTFKLQITFIYCLRIEHTMSTFYVASRKLRLALKLKQNLKLTRRHVCLNFKKYQNKCRFQ